MTNPRYPDVPQVAGVPSVLRNLITDDDTSDASDAASEVMSADAPQVTDTSSGEVQWGIYQPDGALAVAPDSIKSFDYKHEWKLPNYPMEDGAFESYNKVQTPIEIHVVMTKGGKEDDRYNFLRSVKDAANSTTLYNIVTPEVRYEKVCVSSYNFKRSATNGVTLLTVEMIFQEIQLAPSAQFVNVASPNGADQVNGGAVLPLPVTTGNTATSANLAYACNAGTPLSTAISQQTTTSSGILAPTIMAPVSQTVTPSVDAQIDDVILSNSPVSSSVAAQANNLLRIQ